MTSKNDRIGSTTSRDRSTFTSKFTLEKVRSKVRNGIVSWQRDGTIYETSEPMILGPVRSSRHRRTRGTRRLRTRVLLPSLAHGNARPRRRVGSPRRCDRYHSNPLAHRHPRRPPRIHRPAHTRRRQNWHRRRINPRPRRPMDHTRPDPRRSKFFHATKHERSGERRPTRWQRCPTHPTLSHAPSHPRRSEQRSRNPSPRSVDQHPATIVKSQPAPRKFAVPVPARVGQHPVAMRSIRNEFRTDRPKGRNPHRTVDRVVDPGAVPIQRGVNDARIDPYSWHFGNVRDGCPLRLAGHQPHPSRDRYGVRRLHARVKTTRAE